MTETEAMKLRAPSNCDSDWQFIPWMMIIHPRVIATMATVAGHCDNLLQ